jgi:hypothetical protein
VWPTANLAIYVPVIVATTVIVRKLWFGSAATGTGNVDMALYDGAGAAVVSATNAAKEAAIGIQSFDVTDTTIGAGLYFLGLASDSGTDTFMRAAPAAPLPLSTGILTESSAYPLPATATWTANQTLAFVPAVGMLIEATVA